MFLTYFIGFKFLFININVSKEREIGAIAYYIRTDDVIGVEPKVIKSDIKLILFLSYKLTNIEYYY